MNIADDMSWSFLDDVYDTDCKMQDCQKYSHCHFAPFTFPLSLSLSSCNELILGHHERVP